jgi:5-formyltetrahydrofolate cyclo-ligase
VREEVWTALMRARVVGYPLPPHGHHPNFTGSALAGRRLLDHPSLAALDVLAIGPERALLGARKAALTQGRTILVPHPHVAGRAWRLTGDPKGADLKRMADLGTLTDSFAEARGALLACVAVDVSGARLSKGFGWAARGLEANVPQFTLAHPLMLRASLPCEADSRVALIGLPGEVREVAGSART